VLKLEIVCVLLRVAYHKCKGGGGASKTGGRVNEDRENLQEYMTHQQNIDEYAGNNVKNEDGWSTLWDCPSCV